MSNDLTIVGCAGFLGGTEKEFRFFEPLVRNSNDELFVIGTPNPASLSHLIPARKDGPLLLDIPESIQVSYKVSSRDEAQKVIIAGPRIVELLLKYLPDAPLTQKVQDWPVATDAGHRAMVGTIEDIQIERGLAVQPAFIQALQELKSGTIRGEAYDLFYSIYPNENLEVVGYLGIYATAINDEELLEKQLVLRAEHLGLPKEHYRTLISQMSVAFDLRGLEPSFTVVGFVGDIKDPYASMKQNMPVLEDVYGRQFVMGTPDSASPNHLLPAVPYQHLHLFADEKLRGPFIPSTAPLFDEEQTVATVSYDCYFRLTADFLNDPLTQQLITWTYLDATMRKVAVVNRKQFVADRQAFLRRLFPVMMANLDGGEGDLIRLFKSVAPVETLEYLSFLSLYYQSAGYASERKERVVARAKRHGVTEEEFQELVEQTAQEYL